MKLLGHPIHQQLIVFPLGLLAVGVDESEPERAQFGELAAGTKQGTHEMCGVRVVSVRHANCR